MKPKVSVYLTMEELAQLKKAAQRRHVSLSRYAKERLAPEWDQVQAPNEMAMPGGEQLAVALREQLGETVRKAFAARADELAEHMHTVMAMLDQLVLSTLTHLPEIPVAQQHERVLAGMRRHQAWQQKVAEELRKLRAEINGVQQPATNGHGADA
jgi:hypothetical protein